MDTECPKCHKNYRVTINVEDVCPFCGYNRNASNQLSTEFKDNAEK